MTKTPVDPFDHAAEINHALQKGGVLLTTKAGGRVNSMTIGWGAIGNEWGRPCFTAYIRTGRFTTQLLEANPEFTISVPGAGSDRRLIGYLGSHSGRDGDKMAAAGVTLVEPEVVSVPGIAGYPLTLECRVVYRQEQVIADMLPEDQARFYPQDVPSENVGSNRDVHVMYMGQIVAAYLAE